MRALLLFVLVLAVPALALAQEAGPPAIDVVDIRGPIDRAGAEFIVDAIESAKASGAQAVILQIDSPGAVDEAIVDAIELVGDAPLPVIAWIGDAPATARGGALELAAAAPLTLAAPGSTIGLSSPLVVGTDLAATTDLADLVEVSEGSEVIDRLEPALGPLIIGLDGVEISTAEGPQVLATAAQITTDDGTVRTQVAPQVRFQEPGLWARTLRLALAPEAIYFFLVVGLSFVAFEFYAIGPGIAAATAAVPLLLAGYGLVVLPVGWGLWVVVAAMWLLSVDYQRGGFGVVSYVASVLLLVGGWFIVDTRPQIAPSGWAVAVITIGVVLFYMFAMPTVARSRFTTQTMGRDYLVDRRGVAVTDAVDGALVVDIDGTSWRGTTFRESTIQAGSPVRVESVKGLYLEVVEAEPLEATERENKSQDLE